MILSIAEKANAFSVDDNRAYSDGGSRKDQYSDSRCPPRRDPYTMEVDRGKNCYACRGFGHMACHCRNRRRGRVANGRRLQYGEWNIKGNHEYLNYLKEEENLESLN